MARSGIRRDHAFQGQLVPGEGTPQAYLGPGAKGRRQFAAGLGDTEGGISVREEISRADAAAWSHGLHRPGPMDGAWRFDPLPDPEHPEKTDQWDADEQQVREQVAHGPQSYPR